MRTCSASTALSDFKDVAVVLAEPAVPSAPTRTSAKAYCSLGLRREAHAYRIANTQHMAKTATAEMAAAMRIPRSSALLPGAAV